MSTPETPLTGPAAEAALRRLTRRSFLVGGAAALAAAGGFSRLAYGPPDDGIPWFLRRVLRANEGLGRGTFSADRLARTFDPRFAVEPRVNGRYGLQQAVDAAGWRVRVEAPGAAARDLSLATLAGLPRTEHVTEFKCIEGWSDVVRWGGVRFADFAAKFGPAAGAYEYVGLATPGGGYYVGLDAASALHPQTLLCDTMNGAPLTSGHGGPLRLVIPVKYGIKNIKQIGRVSFTNDRPADYWAERGYDWYAGL
ncbi:MAG TPA: molybdopterin-dependent oxidoreductase [Gemmataceae bacterium]|nr:molybdopterin-dependent oxidoreductase [Gemmataceae bacterium]